MTDSRDRMEFDVLFVGGGPANLAGAIHLMNMARKKGLELEVCIIEKGSTIGSHSLSGAILDPVALKELMPDYIEKGCPIESAECKDSFYYLTPTSSFCMPFMPKYMNNEGMNNEGYFIISLSKFTAWLGEIAEGMGVNIFPGFPGTEVLYDPGHTRVLGVATGDNGVNKDGKHKPNFEQGIDLIAKATVLGEGPKGSLIRNVGQKMGIFNGKMPQVFETAIKEVIELPEDSPFMASDTTVVHSFGYPLGLNTKGGSFLYKMKDNMISLGLVIGLDYEDPALEPYEAFLQYKKHPLIADIIKDGKVLQQGAKTLSAGGLYTIPQLSVDGALFVGDSASMLNIQRLKGVHTAMKSGMLAAEAIISAVEKNDFTRNTLASYDASFEESWIRDELYEARNFTQAMAKKIIPMAIHLGAQYVTGGRGIKDPLKIEPDSSTLKKLTSKQAEMIDNRTKEEVDGKLHIDKLTGVYLSGTQHEEDQPCHLIIHDLDICSTQCYQLYRSPCTRFCPGEVYEIKKDETSNKIQLKLNPSNCLHCKTCEIKDPFKNITWTCPEGGGGPGYSIV
ncbi:electron transfer flavoprotein-ubiquinone oxidoreductase [Desulfosarcina sp. BuS5]|uniref:electron transfer flavoprotein-ubiquinone oxidoreductase n=1 Tax=Desulfosarcina sp. BuS5 TaxID=933262 RepID=UPI00048022F6|nr:electron transfer flavoprotein-ubiquinone oxidoreductase [Desulfosarcina sp. BuS5]